MMEGASHTLQELQRMRHAMQGADVPVALFGWMKRAEELLADLVAEAEKGER